MDPLPSFGPILPLGFDAFHPRIFLFFNLGPHAHKHSFCSEFGIQFLAKNGNVDKSVENLMGSTGNQSEENVNFTVKLFCTTPKKFSACIFYTLLKEILARKHLIYTKLPLQF